MAINPPKTDEFDLSFPHFEIQTIKQEEGIALFAFVIDDSGSIAFNTNCLLQDKDKLTLENQAHVIKMMLTQLGNRLEYEKIKNQEETP